MWIPAQEDQNDASLQVQRWCKHLPWNTNSSMTWLLPSPFSSSSITPSLILCTTTASRVLCPTHTLLSLTSLSLLSLPPPLFSYLTHARCRYLSSDISRILSLTTTHLSPSIFYSISSNIAITMQTTLY